MRRREAGDVGAELDVLAEEARLRRGEPERVRLLLADLEVQVEPLRPPEQVAHAHRRVHLPLAALRVHAGRRRREPLLLGDGDDDVRHARARVGRAVDEHLG